MNQLFLFPTNQHGHAMVQEVCLESDEHQFVYIYYINYTFGFGKEHWKVKNL